MYAKLIILILFLFQLSLFPEEQANKAKESDFLSNDYKKTEILLQLKDLQSKALNSYYKLNIFQADAIIKEIQSIAPDSIEYYYIAGVANYVKKNYLKSIESLDRVIQLNSDHELSLYLLGMNYAALNKWEAALSYFQKANIATYNPYYQMNLSIAYLKNNDIPKAITSLHRAIELKENYSEAKVLLSQLLKIANQTEQAYKICEEEKSFFATDGNFAIHCAGLAFTFKKDYYEVVNILGKRQFLDFESRKILGKSYYFLQEYKLAEPIYKNFIYSQSSTIDEGLAYIEILVFTNGNGELEKFKKLFLEKNPDKYNTADELIKLTIVKRDSINKFYNQFKQIR